jgi:hypothetical protein
MTATKIKTKRVSAGYYQYGNWDIMKDDENEDCEDFDWRAEHPDLGEYWARTKSELLVLIKDVEDKDNT